VTAVAAAVAAAENQAGPASRTVVHGIAEGAGRVPPLEVIGAAGGVSVVLVQNVQKVLHQGLLRRVARQRVAVGVTDDLRAAMPWKQRKKEGDREGEGVPTANKQTSKQANKQTSKQANKQTSKQANKQTSKQANKQTRKQANKLSN
jgi:hypothetical protein